MHSSSWAEPGLLGCASPALGPADLREVTAFPVHLPCRPLSRPGCCFRYSQGGTQASEERSDFPFPPSPPPPSLPSSVFRHRLDAVVCGSHCPWPARGPGREAPSFAQETVYTQRADLSSFSAHPAGPQLVAERPCLSPPSGSPAFLAQPRLSLWNVSWWHRPPPGVHKGTGVFVRADPPPHAEPDAA